MNDEAITSTSHLINYVAAQAPHTTVTVSVERGEEALDLEVAVGERKVQNTDKQFIPLPE